jgi:hypothetical protein
MWQNSQIFGYIHYGIQINKYSCAFFNWIFYFSQTEILIGGDGDVDEGLERR